MNVTAAIIVSNTAHNIILFVDVPADAHKTKVQFSLGMCTRLWLAPITTITILSLHMTILHLI